MRWRRPRFDDAPAVAALLVDGDPGWAALAGGEDAALVWLEEAALCVGSLVSPDCGRVFADDRLAVARLDACAYGFPVEQLPDRGERMRACARTTLGRRARSAVAAWLAMLAQDAASESVGGSRSMLSCSALRQKG